MNKMKFVVMILIIMASLLISPISSITTADDAEPGIGFDSMGVSLYENGSLIAYRNYRNGNYDTLEGTLFTKMLSSGEKLQINHTYNEELSVYNSGNMSMYVGATIYKYWLNEDGTVFNYEGLSGEKFEDLIDLNFNLGDGWAIYPRASNYKSTVLYYRDPLQSGQYTTNVLNSVSISPKIYDYYNETTQGEKIVRTYIASGKKFVVECQISSLQDHNVAGGGMEQAWGITYDEFLSLFS